MWSVNLQFMRHSHTDSLRGLGNPIHSTESRGTICPKHLKRATTPFGLGFEEVSPRRKQFGPNPHIILWASEGSRTEAGGLGPADGKLLVLSPEEELNP